MRKTIILAMKNKKLRQKICTTLLLHPRYKVEQVFDNCSDAYNHILQHSPSIAFFDHKLNEECGIEIAKKLKNRGARTKIGILTNSDNKELLYAALEFGVLGYFSVEKLKKQLTICLDNMSRDRYFIDSSLFKQKVLCSSLLTKPE